MRDGTQQGRQWATAAPSKTENGEHIRPEINTSLISGTPTFPSRARTVMNKTNTLIFGLGIALTSVAPPLASAQSAPSAVAESAAKAVADAPRRATTRPTRRPLAVAPNAPSNYTVVRGDTLWDISAKFLKEPWRWPEIWNMNRSQITDPHWIYPGDVISLTYDADGNPRLSINAGASTGGTVKLSPTIRTQPLSQAIPSIPARVIGPFLTLPLVIEEGQLAGAPRIVATEDERVIVGSGNRAYAAGIRQDQGLRWQVYRPGKALKDPNSEEILGYEAVYLGDARVTRFGTSMEEGSTLELTKSTTEISRGDRLTPTAEAPVPSYSPRAPEKQMRGSIISLPGDTVEGAQYSVVVLGLGKRDGIEVGHVMAAMRSGRMVSTDDTATSSSSIDSPVKRFFKHVGEDIKKLDQFNKEYEAEQAGKKIEKKDDSMKIPAEVRIPDERVGLVFVFRTFEKVSYGLVMSSTRPIKVGDTVQTP
jgi:LysM domain